MFKKILIANRGEIACRIVRTCQRLGIRTVAVHSDADAHALHVEMADETVRIGPPPVRESYLNASAIIDAARSKGAQAIHPGYGLLSEKGAFARQVRDAGIVFIGPSPEVLDAVGDKVSARAVARSAGVEPVPGSDESVTGNIDAARASGERIGYPIIVKAVGGGGGIGMQIVTEPSGLERAIKTCADRGRAAFGDERVYLERYLLRPRHVEIQILGSTSGKAMSLGERECSVQRRHQKVLEESPSPASFFEGAAGTTLRRAVEDAALRVVEKVGYVGAGTCELIFDDVGTFYFLEVNARLQVEHPVTEMCTGIDIVEQQLRVANGEHLRPEIMQATRNGHAIEVRVYAEDPAKSFAPQPGKLARLVWPEVSNDLRVETGVREGDDVTPFYDPLLAKIIAHAPTRTGAIARLSDALAKTTIDLLGPRGAASTNIDFLKRVLVSADFVSGNYDTGLVSRMGRL